MPSRPLSLLFAALVFAVAVGPVAGFASPATTADDPGSPAAAESAVGPVTPPSAPNGAGASSEALPVVDPPPRIGSAVDLPVARAEQSLGSGNVTWTISVDSAGDASWEVTKAVAISDDSDRAAFEDAAAAWKDGEGSLGLGAFDQAAAMANGSTNRSMGVDAANATRDATLGNETGELVLRFTWRNFGERDGERLVVDDAFLTENGTWLSPIDEGWALVIEPPDGYNIVEAPRIVNRTVRWDGPFDFEANPPSVVFSGEHTPTPTVSPTVQSPGPSPTSPGTTPTDGGAGAGGFPSLLAIAAVAALAAMTAALLAAYARGEDGAAGLAAITDFDFGGDGGADGAATADAASPSTGSAEAGSSTDDAATESGPATTDSDATGASVGSAAAGGAAVGATAGESGGTADEVDEALLSDEERVERLLERNGGRMKQATIVKETGWSNAKVSQLLSSMDDEDRIDKLRIGRENLISFPDEDVTDVDSE